MTPEKKNVTASVCPACGYVVDSATAIDGSGAQPAVGDFTICLKCHCALKFGYDFQLEYLTAAEVFEHNAAVRENLKRKPSE